MANNEGSDFIVRIDGIKLPPATEKQISQEIQATVLSALAKIDTKGDFAAHIPRKDWIGLWARLREIPELGTLRVNEFKR